MITSVKNPRIRTLRQLRTAKGRREQQLFLLEGTHLLEAALLNCWPLHSLYHTSSWAAQHPQLLAALPQTLPVHPVSDSVLTALATTTTPDGVIAIAHHRSHRDPQIGDVQLGLALQTLQDPGNVGTILRTAVAVGADALWLTPDSVDPEHPKLLRASAGQWFQLIPQVLRDPEDFFATCRQRGVQIVATSAQGSRLYWEVDWRLPSLILVGNEGSGLGRDWLGVADQIVRIPMEAGVESLNVGISAGLILYEAYRQRIYRSP
ncbi:MAG: RNA methyltransferase [Thermostichales cyanobacterium SZTDM-1c_bins_54]